MEDSVEPFNCPFGVTLRCGWLSFPEFPDQVWCPEPLPVVLLVDAFRRVIGGRSGRLEDCTRVRNTQDRAVITGTPAQTDMEVKAPDFLQVAWKWQVSSQSSGSPL